MELFRLVKESYANQLSGSGAAKYGGRWNSASTEMIYCASNRALAMAEVLIHLNLNHLPPNYQMLRMEYSGRSISEIQPNALPADWTQYPPGTETQKLGDKFCVDMQHLILKVPSAVVMGDFNYLINPKHPKLSEIKIMESQPFPFNERYFAKSLV